MNPNTVVLSHATYVGPSGATAAATYTFFTRKYRSPAEPRHVDSDTVHNQNGKFKYVYDSGPGFRRWAPFDIVCEGGVVSRMLNGASAATQYARLREMWNYKGVLGMEIAAEVYQVHWAQDPLEPLFRIFPRLVGDTVERTVSVQFEEG